MNPATPCFLFGFTQRKARKKAESDWLCQKALSMVFFGRDHRGPAPQLTGSEKITNKQFEGEAMKYGELTLGQIEATVNKLGGMKGVSRFLAGEMIIPPVEPSKPRIEREFTLPIDYSMTHAEMIRATGCDWIYSWILEHCPPWKGSGKVTVKAVLIDMGRNWERDDALAAIEELGLIRAPDNAALWTLSREHPDLQREIWVVDPETGWTGESGNSCVAVLDGSADKRSARLYHVANRWNRNCRVLALRQSLHLSPLRIH